MSTPEDQTPDSAPAPEATPAVTPEVAMDTPHMDLGADAGLADEDDASPAEVVHRGDDSVTGTFDSTEVADIPNPDTIKLPIDEKRLIVFNGYDEDELTALYDERVRVLGAVQFVELAEKSGTYENILVEAIRNMSSESARIQDAISANPNKDKLTSVLVDPNTGKKILRSAWLRPSTGSETFTTGQSDYIAARMRASRENRKSIKRIPLYNSGFAMDVRAVNGDDIYNGLIRKCRLDNTTYGSLFGAHYYMYANILLLQNFASFLLSIVVRANLENYEKAQVLLDGIYYPDIPAIFNHIASVIWEDGYPEYAHFCTRPIDEAHPNGCSHHEIVKLDVDEMLQVDFPRMNSAAVEHMTKAMTITNMVSKDQQRAYLNQFDFKKDIEFKDMRLTMRIPTISDMLLYGEEFNKELTNEIQADNVKGIYDALAFRQYRLYLPWIEKLTLVNSKGEPTTSTTVSGAIAELLDDALSDDPERELGKRIYEYINAAGLSNVGYEVFACPKCGYMPKTKSGFFTVDPCRTFFTQAVRKLTLG